MGFDLFILPFTAGLIFLLGYFIVQSIIWICRLNRNEKLLFLKGIPSFATFRAIREVILESLVHRKIFRTNPFLGYMHMSLAFGWFLLILIGNIEAFAFRPGTIHPPYYPIFFRFFEPAADFKGAGLFLFFMDLILLLVLSGVFLALIKRFRSSSVGMQKTSQLQLHDKIALFSLWIIFPSRLLAESFTSGIAGNGGFMTGSLGLFFSSFLPVDKLAYPAWWCYSLSLGAFFFTLPFSRYMHIPTEVLLIFLRNYGIKTNKNFSSFSEIEVHSCSRCGICIDPCPMIATGINTIQSIYFIRNIRQGKLQPDTAQNCLMCGKCNESCPVGIDNYALRMITRESDNNISEIKFDYIPEIQTGQASVVYFGGCMGQLTPSVTQSMEQIMQSAGEKYIYIDKEESICCGRPLILNGREKDGRDLIRRNYDLIISTGAKLLVTSCPICYKAFHEEYNFKIQIMHHTEYINHLLRKKLISVSKSNLCFVYHDPCELGRGSNIYEQPREVLNSIATLIEPEKSGRYAICCGGSLGNSILQNSGRRKITQLALGNLTNDNPDQIITACPLCKKTFSLESDLMVSDLAEVVAKALVKENTKTPDHKKVLTEVV
jgi:Fe-S oxidoreductase